MPNPRKTALSVLLRIGRDQGYSNIVVDAALESSGLSGRDAAFVTALVYGVLEKRIGIDYALAALSGRETAKIQPKVLEILRLGAYQLLFMDKVPQSAAVNESVALAKASGCGYAGGFVNAVLRKVAASAQNPPLPPQNEDPDGYLSVRYCVPRWMIELWTGSYGREETLGLLESLQHRAPAAARVNPLKTTPQALVERLDGEGAKARVSQRMEGAVEFDALPDLRRLPAFSQGLFILQDYASQLCCRAVGARPGERVIDLCAAPGGKSFGMGFSMEGKGSLLACELYENRLGLIRQGAERLGLGGLIRCMANDAAKPNPALDTADRVLCDVPCSGLGVLRRKPEIRYKKPETFDLLPDLQYSILCEGGRHVAPGGRLVYSTCTLRPAENEQVAERFLRGHPEFTPEALEPEFFAPGEAGSHFVTLFPHRDGTDGFFIARFRRTGGT